ncbi:Cu2+-exporting ATPase [Prosthecobacter fusiformis]|uniref:Cu2+-exporting ATPase n=1 Tax=Prosthecobacter fusiformis TaxID=48464 RepID=A0A4R7RZP6_9BACT|nr:heavy metal translocating P-type ATPase metal-binding domain-containing protein [Prosthecobacter fusiformis]TDU71460.1 Cu2+-exporting ATPase [Prosthecobacter fusiformis]
MLSSVLCKHCGTPVPSQREDGFCCTGCLYVHDLLHRQGLDHFYDLKGGLSLPPVSPQSLRERDYDWLEELSGNNAKLSAPLTPASRAETMELRLSLQGISCIGCVWLIEKVFTRQAGGLRVNVDVVHGDMTVVYAQALFDPVAFAKDLQSFGYLVGPPQEGEQRGQDKGLERRMGVCGAFAMNAMAFSLPAYFGMPAEFAFASWFDMIAAVSATLAMLVGGSYFIGKAWQSLRVGMLHIDAPIALGIIAAYAGSMGGWIAGVEGLKYFDFVAIFIFLMLAGRWAQQAAVERNRRKLMRDTSVPECVKVLGEEQMKPLSVLKAGVKFTIKAGQSIPVACRLLSDHAFVSLEWINGESDAQQRSEGQMLPSGALNIGTRSVEAEALEGWQESTLRKLLEARRPGEYRDLKLERLLRVYLMVVVGVGIGGAGWWLMNGAGVAAALQVMISIFVVSCPCALGVAVPLAEELAASRAERLGVFVRNLGLWKRLMRVRRVVFDKTGTLTLENPVLENPQALKALDGAALLALRTLVTGNLHPVSRSLFDAVGPGTAATEAEVTEVIGQGLQWRDGEGVVWALGKGAGSDALFTRNGHAVAGFLFRDELRGESVEEVRALGLRGLRVHILSGDREAKVAHIATQLGLKPERWISGMTPEEKAAWVAEQDEDDTLYIGDGANDSLAFDAALCAGSPVTGRSFLEQKADFFFLGQSLRFVSGLLDTARLHRRATRRVFAFSVVYNIATVVAGLMGHLSPLAAAILMPLSSVATLSIVAGTFAAQRQNEARVILKTRPRAQLKRPALA